MDHGWCIGATSGGQDWLGLVVRHASQHVFSTFIYQSKWYLSSELATLCQVVDAEKPNASDTSCVQRGQTAHVDQS